MSDRVWTLSNDEIMLATDDAQAIHLKVVTPHGDPVELSAEEARELARLLLEAAELVE